MSRISDALNIYGTNTALYVAQPLFPGGMIFVDSSLITRKVKRTDVEAIYIPATQMAMDLGLSGLANMILLGAVIEKTHCIEESSLADALHKVIPARKANLFDANMKAIEAGKGAAS